MRILFMGTPEFAVPSLRRLIDDGHEICGVITQPDKPKNRGHKLTFSPVKEYALSRGLTVYQPDTMRDESADNLVRSLNPDLTVVAAYGRILPERILNVPHFGSINVHSSLLPKYRGAAPINWAILNGETTTGVTIMYMAKELDAGDIILCRETEIGPEEDALELTGRLAELGAEALSEAVFRLADGTAGRTPQNHAEYTYAPMLTRDLSAVDWKRSSREIHDQVRGLIPWPCAKTELCGTVVKLYRTVPGTETDREPGTILSAGRSGIEIACGDRRSILIKELQPEGSRRMSAEAYLAGHPVKSENE